MKTWLRCLALATSLLASTPARAVGNSAIGLFAGVGVYDQGFGTKFTIGADYHYRIIPLLSVGVMVTDSLLGSQTGTAYYSNGSIVNGTFSRTLFHLDFSTKFHFVGIVEGLWVGARLGAGYVAESFSSATGASGYVPNPQTGFEAGPALGYDWLFGDSLSVGIDLSYMWTWFSTPWSGLQALSTVKFRY